MIELIIDPHSNFHPVAWKVQKRWFVVNLPFIKRQHRSIILKTFIKQEPLPISAGENFLKIAGYSLSQRLTFNLQRD